MAINMNNLLDKKEEDRTYVETNGIARKPSEKKEQTKKLEEFCMLNKDRLIEWQKTNPHIRPPIYWDDSAQDYYWANRQQRRLLTRQARKAGHGPKLIVPEHLAGEDGSYGSRDDEGDRRGEQQTETSGGDSSPKGG